MDYYLKGSEDKQTYKINNKDVNPHKQFISVVQDQ